MKESDESDILIVITGQEISFYFLGKTVVVVQVIVSE